ncbi:DNA alkylation repair protein, partial [Anaerostipes hadrus]|uniref:DNA alkylation repair protein n=1 Tax=Anaerostipes hadrus TaxID=649756 RepID=UPI001FA722B0
LFGHSLFLCHLAQDCFFHLAGSLFHFRQGLRIWTSRPYFKEHPQMAIQFLSSLKDDESEYVRKSIGNALKDISKKYPELVSNELKQWDLSSKEIKQVHKLASAYLNKS